MDERELAKIAEHTAEINRETARLNLKAAEINRDIKKQELEVERMRLDRAKTVEKFHGRQHPRSGSRNRQRAAS